MRKDLLTLPWLTAEQALVVLKDQLGYEMSYRDLMSQCQYHHCEVFIHPGATKGMASEALPDGEADWTTACWASGPQKVLNPEALAGSSKVKLYLSGTVFTLDEGEHRSHGAIAWEADIDLDECAVQLQTSAIQDLADLITSLSKPLDPREKKSLLQIISVLASMSKIDPSKPYAAYPAMAEEASSQGIKFELTDDTVKKHLEAAIATR